ncbi:MAG: hypothetical protein IJQ06_09485 [Paludibacteraceae bacterium]|nr:hypothetical protein [Paludibacteraceae bacterium]
MPIGNRRNCQEENTTLRMGYIRIGSVTGRAEFLIRQTWRMQYESAGRDAGTLGTNAEREYRRRGNLPTPQAPKEPSRIPCGTIEERRSALTEIARTGHR